MSVNANIDVELYDAMTNLTAVLSGYGGYAYAAGYLNSFVVTLVSDLGLSANQKEKLLTLIKIRAEIAKSNNESF